MSNNFNPVAPILPVDLAEGTTMDFQVIPPVAVQQAAHQAVQPLSFLMGSRAHDDDEEPRHRVVIPEPFYLGTFPVTQAQFAIWTGSTDYAEWFARAHERQEVDETTPHQNSFSGSPLLPAENLNWYEAKAFLQWLNQSGMLPAGLEGRLPSEAEWEYACRAGTETEYWSGDGEAALREVGWYDKNSEGRTHAVGEKGKPNPWGLHDLHGNVFEWCEDVWDAQAYSKRPDGWQASPWGSSGSPGRVLRGGSSSFAAGRCRSAYRDWGRPRLRVRLRGFRVLLSLPGPVAEPQEPVKRGTGREGAGGTEDRPGDRKAGAASALSDLDQLRKPDTPPA